MRILNKLLERFAGQKPSPAETERDRVSSVLSQAEESLRLGDLSGTAEFCAQAEARLANLANQPVTVESRRLIGDGNFDIGSIYRDIGRLDQAERAYRKGLAAWQELVGEAPHNVEFQERMAACFNHLGNLEGDRGALDRAETAYQSAMAIRSDLQRAEFPTEEGDRQNGVYLGGVLCNLGHIAARQGKTTNEQMPRS